MRLSKGEVFFGLILLCLVLLTVSHSPFSTLARTIQGNHHLPSSASPDMESRLKPIRDIVRFLESKPVQVEKGEVIIRGSLPPGEAQRWRQHLLERGFKSAPEEHGGLPGLIEGKMEVSTLTKEEGPTSHRIKMVNVPQQNGGRTNYIYVWAGQPPLDFRWFQGLEAVLKDHFSQRQPIPEIFACFYAISDDRLKQDLFDLGKVQTWLEADLKAELIDQVADSSFISLTGYVSAWDTFLVTAQQRPINVQLSLRHNTLDQSLRLTVGYPLILTAH